MILSQGGQSVLKVLVIFFIFKDMKGWQFGLVVTRWLRST